MVHAVSATFERFEHMSPPAAGMALLLHVLVAAFLVWAPTHHHDTDEEPIEVTMEAPPPPPPKPEIEPPKPPPPPAAAAKPPPAPALDRLGLPPPGPVGPKSTAPPMERGLPTYELPAEKAEQPAPKEDPAAQPPPPQQAMAQPAPPPPPPTLEKELPPVEAPPAPLTSRDIPRFSPPIPERKPEPVPPQPQQRPQPPHPAAPPSPQLQPSPLSRLPRNAPSQRQPEQPRSTFVNPADTYAQNTVLEAYLQRVVYQVSRYSFDGAGLSPTDSVVARFTIARNGSLLAVSIIRSSGKPSLDRDAVTAFQRTAPFPPLPADVPGDSQTFSLTFFPGRRP